MKNKRQEFIWIDLGACIYPTRTFGLSCGIKKREIEKSKNGVKLPTRTLRNGKDMLTCPMEHGRISRRSYDWRSSKILDDLLVSTCSPYLLF